MREVTLAPERDENCAVGTLSVVIQPAAIPHAPMGWIYLNPAFGPSVDPSAKDTAARKDERMQAALVDDGQFELLFERCGGNRLPHCFMMRA